LPSGGLLKTFQTFAPMVKDSYGKLSEAYNRLVAGKSRAAEAADPGAAPDLTEPESKDASVLGKKVWQLQYNLSLYNNKLQASQAALNALPIPKGAGISTTGDTVLVDDFEAGMTENKLKGNWATEADNHNLGTLLNPIPFKPSPRGSAASPQAAAHILGHFGKSQAPWPTALLVGTLSADNKAVDLSGFSALRFWVKGDGKAYSVILAKSSVQDSGHFRQDFKTTGEWAQVTLNFSDFKQPDWGKQVPLNFSDVLYMAFSPNAKFNDESMDLWVDDVTLVK